PCFRTSRTPLRPPRSISDTSPLSRRLLTSISPTGRSDYCSAVPPEVAIPESNTSLRATARLRSHSRECERLPSSRCIKSAVGAPHHPDLVGALLIQLYDLWCVENSESSRRRACPSPFPRLPHY